MTKEDIRIIIISKTNNIELIDQTINSILESKSNIPFTLAIKNEDEFIKEYINSNNISYITFNKYKDIYEDYPKKINNKYLLFIHEGDLLTISNNEYDFNDNDIVITTTYENADDMEIDEYVYKTYLNINAVIIKRDILLKNYDMAEDEYYYEVNLLTKLIVSTTNTIFTKMHEKIGLIKSTKLCNYDIKWYENIFTSFDNIKKYSIKKYNRLLPYIQNVYMKLLIIIMVDNANTKNKHVIVNDSLDKFNNNMINMLQDINYNFIIRAAKNKLINYYLLKLKYNINSNEYNNFGLNTYLSCNGLYYIKQSDFPIDILLMDFKDGNLNIIGQYAFPFDEDRLKIFATYKDNKYYAKKVDLFSDYKVFGKAIYDKYSFSLSIPLEESNEKEYIKFWLDCDGFENKLAINFKKPLSRLTKSRAGYWAVDKYTINYRQKGLMVLKNNKLRQFKRETKLILSLLFNKSKLTKKCGIIRIIYHITHPFYKNKRIWLFEDKIYKGGDNGEYLYTYAINQKDNIKKYYILDKHSLDAKRFRKEHKKFVQYCSIKHKMLYLNSEIVFNTHNSSTAHHSFSAKVEKHFRGLFNTNNVCIQHGLSVQKIPNLVNRINDDLKLFFLASEVEKKNLLNKEYSYKGYEDVLKITGCPRYDGLKDNDQKQILITPTWRNYLAVPVTNLNSVRGKNEDFIKSDYFKLYNNLINDKKLIETAKKTGYKLIYLLHPCTSSQIDDFDSNDFVELVASTDDLNYEKIMTESSLMVTDYSGVQFDFAYMYKPIVYYHPIELPPSYDEGEYKYETMSLGEIVKTHKELVDSLCQYMNNNCKIKNEYKKRIDKFFKYHDYNNCQRIYDIVKDYFIKK
ncbi:MAG: CDP-glycerol glycerophosphotransferase family protein [Bacilli bacterium]|nr:CDP-glycerol glycerophosphotransferase family protein [Bacilli bacterium]